MPIYEVCSESLISTPVTSFENVGLRERTDIQRLLKKKIECLEDGLMVIAEEFSEWVDSSRRIDLLCLDRKANLVVVEIKRDADGGHIELQALRYAAMVSTMKFEQAVRVLANFRDKISPDEAKAQSDILSFLGWDDPQEDAFAIDTRVVLAAANFGKEITTSVLWLRSKNIDISCVRLEPYQLRDGQILLNIQPLIPLPETKEFQTRLGDKRQAERSGQVARMERHDLRLAFLSALQRQAGGRLPTHAGQSPSEAGILSGSTGKSGFSLNFVVRQEHSRVELLIQTSNAKEQLSRLKQKRDTIEAALGTSLTWQEKEDTRQCRIFKMVDGGYRSVETEWPQIQNQMIELMIRLEAAIRSEVKQLP